MMVHFSSVIKANRTNEGRKQRRRKRKKWIPLRPLTTSAIIRTAEERGVQSGARLRAADSLGLRKMTDGAAPPAGGGNIKLK